MKTIEELYDANDGNQTNIPVINDRTLLFTNYPHSSPMWRKSLHDDPKIGYFDESYISAGDAEFWYRVSRLYPNGFDTISIPLSLYFQNPEGLSTRPNTYGAIEHTKCSKEHYDNLIEKIEKNVDTTFSKNYLKHCDINNLSIFAAKSSSTFHENKIIDAIFFQMNEWSGIAKYWTNLLNDMTHI